MWHSFGNRTLPSVCGVASHRSIADYRSDTNAESTMESSTHYNNHPSVFLLNELEILSTQIRLMELYIKQAQATAAAQATQVREQLQAELGALQIELKEKETALDTYQALARQADENLRAEIQELRAQLLESQHALETRSSALEFARSEAAELRQGLGQLESAVREARTAAQTEVAHAQKALQAELTALKTKLERKESALQRLQASIKELEAKLGAQIEELRTELTAKAELLEHRTQELHNARTETAALLQRVHQLELTGKQSEAAASEATRIRENLQAELAALRTAFEQKDSELHQNRGLGKELEERLNAQLRELQGLLAHKQEVVQTQSREIAQLKARTNGLHEQIVRLELSNEQAVAEAQAAADALQDGFRARVAELETAASENAELLQQRAAELQNAYSQMAVRDQRIHQLELAIQQAEAEKNEAGGRHEILQKQLAYLQRALEQSNASLEEQQAKFRKQNERFNAEVCDLQGQVAEKQRVLEAKDAELRHALANTAGLAERVHQFETSGHEAQAAAADQAERIRQEAQSELTALQTKLREREEAFQEQQASSAAFAAHLNGQIENLRNELAQNQQSLEQRKQEIQTAYSETAMLHGRIAHLESGAGEAQKQAAQVRAEFQAELAAREAELKDKERGLAESHALARQSEGLLRTQIDELQLQIGEKQLFIDRRNAEIVDLESRLSAVSEKLVQVEATGQETLLAANETERGRRALEVELAARQEELRNTQQALAEREAQSHDLQHTLGTQLHHLQIQLAEKQGLVEARDREIGELTERAKGLQERVALLGRTNEEVEKAQAAARALEEAFRARTAELEAETSEKTELLEKRAADLEHARSEIAALLQRVHQLELDNERIQAAATEATRTGESLQSELVALRAAHSQKDASLQQQEAFARDMEARLNGQLRDLQIQLAEKQGLVEARDREIGELTERAKGLQERVTLLERTNEEVVGNAQAAASVLEAEFRGRVAELQLGASENAELLQNRTTALENARSEIAALLQRVHQLELNNERIQAAATEATRTGEGLQSELVALRAAHSQKDASLQQQETFARDMEARLNAELGDLQDRLAQERVAHEKQKCELDTASNEITALRDRARELEAVEKAASVETQRISARYETEIGNLRAVIEQREQALDERHATTRAVEDRLNGEIHRLEVQLVEAKTSLDRSGAELAENRLEISGLREQVAQLDLARKQTETLSAAQAELRERVKTEIGALDAQLAHKEAALKIMENRALELEAAFNSRVDELNVQIAEKQLLIKSRDTETTDLRQRIGNLVEQISHLERANGEIEEQHRVAAANLESSLRIQIDDLQSQVADTLAMLETRDGEIRRVRSEITELVSRLSQAEGAARKAETRAAGEIAQIRRRSQGELAALQMETEQKVELLQKRQAAVDATEHELQVEIANLRTEVKEKHGLLQSRNDELVRTKTEMDALQERITQLESESSEAAERFHRPESISQENKNEAGSISEELARKERVLEDRQAAVNDSEEGFRAKIESLRSELAEKQALLESPTRGFLLGEPTLNESQKEKLSRLEQLVEAIKADNEQMLPLPHSRRWRFSLGRKRRWKS
jgi:chromosome segregation ATPase